ncbi:MAG: hypothetical protein ABWZ74_11540 [Hyphomicrobiaceae bacterium]|jgi:hypothetical protein
MASPLGRSTPRDGSGVNGSGRSASSLTSIPQTLSEKLEQELGHDGLSRRLTAVDSRQMRRQAVLAPSGASATNSPQASGPHGFYLDADEDGEERMPILSTWREPLAATQAGWLARQVKAALLGLVLGLVAVIPSVLWLTGRFDAQVAGLQPFSVPDVSHGRSSTDRAAAARSDAPARIITPAPVERPTVSIASEKVDAAEAVEELLSRAQGFITDGNMARAREILSDSALANNPKAAFALAETFDPNILAATGAQGARAEVERARMLYSKALAGGVIAAKRRLDALN